MNKETTTQTEYYENGQKRKEGEHRDGKLHGKWTYWYESGRKEMEVEFQNGKKNGKQTQWYEDANKEIEGEFRDGKPHGLSTRWNRCGKLSDERLFDNGVVIDRVNYYELVNPRQLGSHCKGMKNCGMNKETTTQTVCYENGQKRKEGEVRDGKPHGKWTYWYENGNKNQESEFRDGKPYGLSTRWNRCGKLLNERLFDNGIEIDRVNYYELVNPCDDIWEKLEKRIRKEIDKQIMDGLLGSIS